MSVTYRATYTATYADPVVVVPPVVDPGTPSVPATEGGEFATLFTTPTVAEGSTEGGAFFSRYSLERGITLVRNGLSIRQVRFPAQEELEAADAYWRGGYGYFVTDEEIALLDQSGYGSGLTDVEISPEGNTPVAYPGDELLYPDDFATGDPNNPWPSGLHYPGFHPGV